MSEVKAKVSEGSLPAVGLPAWRSSLVLFLIFLAFSVFALRAVWLQGFSTRFLQEKGAVNYMHTLVLPATRGKIVDRNDQVLASSLPARAIWAVPEEVKKESKDKLRQLAVLLEMSEKELYRRLDSDRTFVYLRRQVEMDVVGKILHLDIVGINTLEEYKRFYPKGEVVANVVGMTNTEGKGLEGMELAYQPVLSGVEGSRRVIRDRLGRVVEDVEDIDAMRLPRNGEDRVLSIDSRLQHIAFSALKTAVAEHKAKAGGVVILDVKSGEILALANMPTYDPNNRRKMNEDQLRNRVLTDMFEPGSTLKPFTVALGLEKRLVTPDTLIDAPRSMKIGVDTIGDDHPIGLATVSKVIEKSSNVGTAKIALQMSPKDMWEMFFSVGFGQQPQINFPGAVAGRVRSWASWRPIEQATMSYGHGISVSLLQIAHAYMIFARDGDMVPLTLQKTHTTPVARRVVSKNTAEQMRKMLEAAAGAYGTARLAQVQGYRVGGKTGTANKLENGVYVQKYVASFVGFAPVSDPRLIVAVMIDEPRAGKYYGGAVAAPVFSAVMTDALRTLNVAPDSGVRDILVSTESLREVL